MKSLDFLLFILIAVILLVTHVKLAQFRIKQWARENGYRLRFCKIRLANIGPFSYFGTSSGQSIFRIEAVSYDGKIRAGFARAGGFFFGLLRKRVEVKWDKNQAFE